MPEDFETPKQSINLFFSYSHRDEALRDELSKHLSILKRQGVIDEWHDRQIPPGGNWARAIDDRIDQARIILLLVSSDFLASDYCHEIEMKRAMERHDRGEAIVVPIILRSCSWQGGLFEKLQALPKDAKPVTSWPNQDEALTNIADGIRAIVNRLRSRAARSAAGPGLGEEVFRLCDRDNQVDAFDAFIRGRDARALVCGIRAAESELPDSLANRLTNITLRDYARSRWGERESVVTGKLISWPDSTDVAACRQSLLSRIYRELGHDGREASAEAFVRAVSARLDKVIVLRHNLRAERWGRTERELLPWYLGFWDEVNALKPAPQFVIFFNLIYPDPPGGVLRSLLQRARFDREAFDRELQALFNGDAKLLLEELTRIEDHHVKDWFARHGIFDESVRLTLCAELFKEGRRRPMNEIEQALKRLHEQFLQQREF